MGLVLRRLNPPRLALRRVLYGRIVQRLLVRARRDHAAQPASDPRRWGKAVTLGAACALAFLAALPQLCSP